MEGYDLTMTLTVKEYKDQLKNWGFKKESKNYEQVLSEVGMYVDDYDEYVAEAIESLTDLTSAVFLDDYVENARILLKDVDDLSMFLSTQSKIIDMFFSDFSNTEGSYIIEAREDWLNERLVLDIYELDAE